MTDWLTSYRTARPPMHCSCYVGRHPCNNFATHSLIDPDGKMGGYVCKDHAVKILKDFRKHLDEKWTLKEIFRAMAEYQESKS